MALEYFNAYHSYLESIEPLNDAERGRLFTALLEYSSSGVTPDLRGNERFVFPTMKGQIDRDIAKYEAKCHKNSASANKRWNANGCERIPTDANDAKEKEKAKEKAKEKDKDKAKDKKIACVRDPFDDFWKAYPKKVGKGDAMKAFAKVKAADREKLIPALEKQKKSKQWLTEGGRFIPNPSTWLNQQRWEDELPIEDVTIEKGCITHAATPTVDQTERLRKLMDSMA